MKELKAVAAAEGNESFKGNVGEERAKGYLEDANEMMFRMELKQREHLQLFSVRIC